MTHILKWTLLIIMVMANHLAMADEGLKSFLQQLEGVDNFQASFEQKTASTDGKVLQALQGTMLVQQPGKLRWETEDPYAQLVISDGQSVWSYDRDLEQVTIRPMDNRIQETPALLLSGQHSQIEKSFQVKLTKKGKQSEYRLLPKDKSQLFDALVFFYQGKILQRMEIHDAAGQITTIVFSQQVVNQTIDKEAFVFNVPDGVDVIDGRSGF